MIVPNCHVQELITRNAGRHWVRVTGVRVWQNGSSVDIPLAPPRGGRQSAVVIALGTIETTRVALTTFQQSLAGRAAQRMGTNLIAHLRSNLTIRVPRAAIAANLPPTVIPSLQCSALLVKGKAPNGRTFHFQITAAGLSKLGNDSEAELFKKMPTLEHMNDMLRANDDTRRHHHSRHRRHDRAQSRQLRRPLDDRHRFRASEGCGASRQRQGQSGGFPRQRRKRRTTAATWDAMDAVADKIALIFAGNQPFEILASANSVIPVPAGTTGPAAGGTRRIQEPPRRPRHDASRRRHDAHGRRGGRRRHQ